jgi:hypothetical protein
VDMVGGDSGVLYTGGTYVPADVTVPTWSVSLPIRVTLAHKPVPPIKAECSGSPPRVNPEILNGYLVGLKQYGKGKTGGGAKIILFFCTEKGEEPLSKPRELRKMTIASIGGDVVSESVRRSIDMSVPTGKGTATDVDATGCTTGRSPLKRDRLPSVSSAIPPGSNKRGRSDESPSTQGSQSSAGMVSDVVLHGIADGIADNLADRLTKSEGDARDRQAELLAGMSAVTAGMSAVSAEMARGQEKWLKRVNAMDDKATKAENIGALKKRCHKLEAAMNILTAEHATAITVATHRATAEAETEAAKVLGVLQVTAREQSAVLVALREDVRAARAETTCRNQEIEHLKELQVGQLREITSQNKTVGTLQSMLSNVYTDRTADPA